VARDPLRILLAVRRQSVEQARALLGACLRSEAEALEGIRLLADAERRERTTCAAWPEALGFVEMAALRREVTRARRRDAEAALAAAEAKSAQARDGVTAARTAAEVVEQLIEERACAWRTEQALQEQHALDDISRPRAGAPQRG
jgi:flagellar biosynthesis chaperone FliJ